MALPNTNITTTLVGQTLGTSSRDVGTLCTHPNINKWSKYKPVPNNELFFTGRDDNNASGRPNWQGMDTIKLLSTSPLISGIQSCGLWIPQLNQYTTWGDVKVAMDEIILNYNWNRSMTQEHFPNFPKRLGDFRGYEHPTDYAKNFWDWTNENDNKAIGIPTFNHGFIHSNIETPWYGFNWFEIPAINELNDTSPYANCIVFKENTNTIQYIFSNNVYISDVPDFPLISTSSWDAGQYKCYWFFSDTEATTGSIPSKIIPLYSVIEAPNPFTYTLESSVNLLFDNYRYSFALGSQLLNYQLLDGVEYYGPYGIHSNFNNTLSNTGFLIAMDVTNNSGGNVIIRGSDINLHLDSLDTTAVEIVGSQILGLHETNQSGAANLISTGVNIANNTTKTIYILVGVEIDNVSNGDQFNINIEQFTILGNGVGLWGYSVNAKYRQSSAARTFYNLSTGNDFTTI